jgi:hypothetical protein
MELKRTLLIATAALALACSAVAQDSDAVDCRDSPVITRMPGRRGELVKA